MHREEMVVERREKSGKGVARTLRRQGKIPGVVYSGGKAESIILSPEKMKEILKHGENALITLKIAGEKSGEPRVAILREIDRDPVSGEILHADLFEISMNKSIRVRVPVHVKGETPAGVKEGGVLQHILREIEIECLPALIPDEVGVDASALGIGDSIHVRELRLAEGIRILEDAEQIVVSVAAPISDAKLEQLLTAPPAETGKEPEVIGKKKEEEEAEGEAKAKPEEKGKPAETKEGEKPAKPSPASGKEGKPKG